MASTGSHLRELRERHGVSLKELAHATRIGQRFLEALETDDFGTLPAGPFAKGFIRSYCQALNEPAGEALALYTTALSASAPRHASAVPPPRAKRSPAPVFVSLALLVVLGGALAGVTVALRSGRGDGGTSRDGRPPGDTRAAPPTEQAASPVPGPAANPPRPMASAPQASPPISSAPLAPAPAAQTSTGLAAPAPPPPRLPSPAGTGTPYRLVARASDPTWIRVRMEGGRTTEETIPAGEVREWLSNRPFELRIGNAGGVTLELNGQLLPPLGARGAVITRLVLPAEPQ